MSAHNYFSCLSNLTLIALSTFATYFQLASPLPSKWSYDVATSQFEIIMNNVLDRISAAGKSLAPTFLFADPFGWAGVSMTTFRRLFQYKYTEVLFTFMVDAVNHWLDAPDQESNFDRIFGLPAWRELGLAGIRSQAALDLLRQGFRDVAHAPYTIAFGMKDKRGRREYFLVHASSDDGLTAVDRMKKAMWRVDPTGTFEFSDRTHDQLTLLTHPNVPELARKIAQRFSGQCVRWSDIWKFVLLDTEYHGDHIKSALQLLEDHGMTVMTDARSPGPARRRRQYPERLYGFMRFQFR